MEHFYIASLVTSVHWPDVTSMYSRITNLEQLTGLFSFFAF